MDNANSNADFKKVYEQLSTILADQKKHSDMIYRIVDHYNTHIDYCNRNLKVIDQAISKLDRYAVRQNVMVGLGVAGFVYLASKIRKLEASFKEE